MNIKPGWKTTEFWVTVVTAVISLAVALGYLTSEQGDSLANAAIIIIGLIVGGLVTVNYTRGRAMVKSLSS